ncbi:MAG: molybdate ABC transporter substrate-binding protein [Betaproteobacteria bacterium]|jgi:molybdate transport system substrate-binding protein|nr:molybdate ABC transporter substrate-binding protein [Betaproteobacteria bacterium]
MLLRWRAVALFSLLVWSSAGWASEVRLAVAANFAAPMRSLAQSFEKATGHKVVVALGATGQLYAQIKNGAPFDVLLAADDETPKKLESEGLAVSGSRATYAIGRLVLWSKRDGLIDAKGEFLSTGRFDRIAIANPKLAPYGLAAIEVIEKLGMTQATKPKVVEASNITQAHQFVASGNAEIGFVALAQVAEGGKIKTGSGWIIPESLHSPIQQDLVLLLRGKANPAAQQFIEFLRSENAKAVIRSYGYTLP